MDKIYIEGGKPLEGKVVISGSKNAALPLMTLSLLTSENCSLKNVPNLMDVFTMNDLLLSLGVKIIRTKDVIKMKADNVVSMVADYDLVRKMRASVLVLGPLLARFGKAEVSLPGGCAIGSRPIDLHISALKKMGAEIDINDGYIKGIVPNGRLIGSDISLLKSSVGATENIIMAASIALGKTVLSNAAMEPEIDDLIEALNKMGAKIKRVQKNIIEVIGVDKLFGFEHTVMSDRIEAGTYAMASVITGGNIKLINADKNNLESVISFLRDIGSNVKVMDKEIIVKGPKKIKSVNLKTEVFPGFPTDLQAQAMALMAVSNDRSIIEESIFENRFMHVAELIRFGANIRIEGHKAIIEGIVNFKGAQVMATDLRASSSLILAGLRAKGQTILSRVYHLDRGYESLEKKFTSCGAKIKRI